MPPLLVAVVLAVGLVVGTASPVAAAASKSGLAEAVNAARVDASVPGVLYDDGGSAQCASDKFAATGEGHPPGCGWDDHYTQAWGEISLWDPGGDMSSQQAIEAYLGSPPHRDILLGETYTHMRVGRTVKDGEQYIVIQLADLGHTEPGPGLQFVESVPCAVFDTSDASDPRLAGRNDGGDVLTFVVASDSALPAGQGAAGCVGPPAGAVAVELNLVARQPAGRGNLKVSAAGTIAFGGVVNFSPGVTNASSVPVPLDGQGRIDVEINSNDDGATFVRGVALGYYVDPNAASPASSGLLFVPSDACAVFDTRGVGGRFDGQETRTFQVAGDFDPQGQGGKDCVPPPADVSGVLVNLVAIGPDNNGNLKAVASGGTASGGVVNFAGGMGNNSNAVPVGVSASGAIDVTANTTGTSSVHVRGVVLGYYVDDGHADAADGLELVPAMACAVFDTRHGEGVFADRTDGGQTVTATVAADGLLPDGQREGGCVPPPAGTEAVMLNLVAITPDDNGNLQLAPAGVAPDGGVVNFTSHRGTNSNAVVTGVDADGDVDVTTKATIADAVDVRGVALGWYEPEGCPYEDGDVATVVPPVECEALMSMLDVNPAATLGAGWGTATDPCDWDGVGCDTSGVTSLVLANSRLTSVPPAIDDLAGLTRLEVGGMALTELPPEIGNLINLTSLSLDPRLGESLSSLPAEIGNLHNLQELDVRNNHELTSLPAEVGNLGNLETLWLSNNALTSLPSGVGSLSRLTDLRVTSNNLTGDITQWSGPLASHDTLETLRLSDGTAGNDCMTVTDPAVADWLGALDPSWDECE